MAEVKAVEFRAELRQVRTMVDHSVNVVLNIPEDCREQVKVMLDWLADEVGVVMVSTPQNREKAGDERKRTRRQVHQGQ
jgi:hypothetical protein